MALRHPPRRGHLRRRAGPRPRRGRPRHRADRRREPATPAPGELPHRARAAPDDVDVVRRAVRGARVRDRPRLPADRRELPVLARSVHHHHGAAGGSRRDRGLPVPDRDHAQRPCAHGGHHEHRCRDGQQHPPRVLRQRAARRARECHDGRHRGRLHPIPPCAHDRAGHDHRHGADGARARGRWRAERAVGTRRHRRSAVRHRRHPRLRAVGVRSAAWATLVRGLVMTTDPASEVVTTLPDEHRRSLGVRPALLVGLAVVAAILGLGIYSGVRARSEADATLKQTTADAAVSVVSVVSPQATAATQEILLPGTTQAFTDAPLFARTSGYVKAWYSDIGARVTHGQLLAEIETPEVDQQLEQARADLETAQANLRQAQITADRWRALLETDSVSKQETDQAVSALSASKATVDSNGANVRRLEQLQGFQKIYAPFDGVITARNVDIGVLINAGSTTTSGRELFHMAAIHTLRVFVAVPEIYSRAALPGTSATITLDEFPGRSFHGTLARTAN